MHKHCKQCILAWQGNDFDQTRDFHSPFPLISFMHYAITRIHIQILCICILFYLLQMYDAVELSSSADQTTYYFREESYNGYLSPGDTLTLVFIATYSGADEPIWDAKLSNQPICGPGELPPQSTTQSVPTTKSSTTQAAVTTKQPKPTTTQPKSTTVQPASTTTQPQATTKGQPQPTTAQPGITTKEPPKPTTVQPATTTVQPQTTTKGQPSTAQPGTTIKEQPTVTTAQTSMTTEGSATTPGGAGPVNIPGSKFYCL